MTAPANRWKLGLFVLSGLAVGTAGLTVLGAHQLQRATHEVWIYFDEALTGLDEGSPVRFRGVQIGVVKVIKVAVDMKHLAVQAALYDERLVELGLDVSRLDGHEPMPTNLRAQVIISWVTGTAFIQVDFHPDPAAGPQQLPFPVGPNTLLSVPSTAKGLEEAGREVLRELPAMAVAARELIDALRTDLAALRLPALAARIDRVLAAAEQQIDELKQLGAIAAATAAVEQVRAAAAMVHDDSGPVVRTLRELQAVATDLRAELARAELAATVGAVRSAAGAATASLGALQADVQRDLGHLRAALGAVERLAVLLEQDPGALLHGRGAPKHSLFGDAKR